jgi:hypothetical protein
MVASHIFIQHGRLPDGDGVKGFYWAKVKYCDLEANAEGDGVNRAIAFALEKLTEQMKRANPRNLDIPE